MQLYGVTRRVAISAAAAALAVFGTMGIAEEASIGQPQGDVILTVSGAIGVTNVGETAQFDIDMLRELGMTQIETTTIWTEGMQSFTGVELAAILETVGASGNTVHATAINDYAIDIPVDEVTGALVAYENHGEPMSVREKGPLWIVFPYDSATEYQSEVVYSRSIWQLDRLELVE